MTSVSLFGVRIDLVSDQGLEKMLLDWIRGNEQKMIVTPNPEFLLHARRDEAFRDLLRRSDLALPDGVGLCFAIAALTDELEIKRQSGVDLLDRLARLCRDEQKSLLLFGGDPGNALASAEVLKNRYPGLVCFSIDPGIVSGDSRQVQIVNTILDQIRAFEPAVLAVALGQGKQERFIVDALVHLPTVCIAIGVGGSFEMLAGVLPRAPLWMRQRGLEWLWRLRLEPHRFRRIFRAVLVFPVLVILATIRQKRFWKGCLSIGRELCFLFGSRKL